MFRVNEAARKLGMKDPTIRLWMAQGKIAYCKLGRAVRIPESEVDRLIRESLIPVRDQRDRRFA